MDKNSLSGKALRELIGNFWVMGCLVCNGFKEQNSKGADFMKEVRKHRVYLHVTKPDCHNQSKVEVVIREMRKKWFYVMLINKVPHRLRNYGLEWVEEIMHSTVGSAGYLHYCTSLEEVTGEIPDIS